MEDLELIDTEPFSEFQKDLESHPLFRFTDDSLLSFIILPVNQLKTFPDISILTNNAKLFIDQIYQEIFFSKTTEELHSEFKQLSLVQKTLCGKLIKKHEIFFRCLDCDPQESPTAYSLLCIECFDKSKPQHEGHRILPVRNEGSTATCDCGDAELFKSEGFCPDHTFKKVSVEELLLKFPKDILERFQYVLKKAFYGVIAFYEIARKTTDAVLNGLLLAFADVLMNEVLAFCILCYSEIDISFVMITELVFKSSFIDSYNGLWHNCEDLADYYDAGEVDITQPHACNCLIIENLLRLANVMAPPQQTQFQKMFVECFNLSESKEFFPIVFTKYLHFMFSKNYSSNEPEDNLNSELLKNIFQLYEREALNLHILNSGYLENTIEILKKAIFSAAKGCYEVYYIVSKVTIILLYFLNPKKATTEQLLKHTDFLNNMLTVLMTFQIKFFYPGQISVGVFDHFVLYDDINLCLAMAKCINEVNEKAIETICAYPEEEKRTFMKKFLVSWNENFIMAKLVTDDFDDQGIQSFHPSLERVLGYAFRTMFGNSIPVSHLESFLEEALPEERPSKIASKAIRGVLKTFGVVRYLHIILNFDDGLLWHVYYFMTNLYFEMDTATIQIMAALVSPEELFQTVTRNFFSYDEELQNFFQNPTCLIKDDHFKQKVSVLQDFLHFLIFMMNDEISFLNLRFNDSTIPPEEELDDRSKDVLRKVLINMLLNYYWTDLIQIKNAIKRILYSEQNIDEIIQNITILDETGQKIRLKEEYISEFDPYLFFRVPVLQANILHNMASRMKNNKDEQADLVSGKYYTNAPQHLKTIQKNFFMSDLPDFLNSCLYEHSGQETSSLVRPMLKLVLLNLQVVNEEKQNTETAKRLEAKVEKCYLTQQFQESLKAIFDDKSFEDCKPCIQKIQDLMKRLSTRFEADKLKASTSMVLEESKVDEDEQKKKLALERMQKMKEKFAQQRDKFSKVHAELLEAHDNEEVTVNVNESIEIEQEKVCQYCLDKITEVDESREYGMPIYVVFTNNFYDTAQEAEFKKLDFSNLSEENWWPVISSCSHYYHKSCFNKVYENSRKPENTVQRNYCHTNETSCLLCKTLCNAFLCFNKTPNVKAESEGSRYSSLAKDLKDLLQSRIVTLQRTIDMEAIEEEQTISIHEIIRRTYDYFIHSFSLSKSGKVLQQQISLYTQFFRALLIELQPQAILSSKPSTFLERLSQKMNEQNPQNKELVTFLLEFQSESMFNEASFYLLISLASATFSFENKSTNNTQFQDLLQEYFAFKTVQLACFEQTQNFKSIEDIISYHKKSQSFQEKLASEFLYPLQLSLLQSTIHNSILLYNPVSEKTSELLLHPVPSLDYLHSLLKSIGVPSPFNKFIESSLLTPSQKSLDHILPLNLMINSSDIANQCRIPRVIRYAPAKIELPGVFAEFNKRYFAQKCSLCNTYSPNLLACVCLICGDVFCLAYCDPSSKQSGNANRHASAYHMGLGLFLSLYDLDKVALSVPINTLWPGMNVYPDKLGQGIQVFMHDRRKELRQKDFKDFLLSRNYVQYYKDIIDQHAQGKEAFHLLQNPSNLFKQGVL